MNGPMFRYKAKVGDKFKSRGTMIVIFNAAGAPSMDPAIDELEKKAIDDVIARMRGSFLRVTSGSKPVNEVSLFGIH